MNIDNPRLSTKILKKSSCNGKGKRKSNKDDSLKVVYISSPMKVKTSAKRFRSLVQQLTGKNSDVWRYMEADDKINGAIEFHEIDCGDDNDESTSKEAMSDQNQLFNSEDTPTSSDTLLGSMSMDNINVFSSQMDEQFAGIFSSDSFFDSSQFDHVLGSYDELL